MMSLRLRLATVATGVAVTFASFLPAQAAMPLPAIQQLSSDAGVTDVQYRRYDERNRYERRYMRNNRSGYYNGHRGYRERRPGYRQHNGMWFPLAAFGAGALIGGAVAADRGPRAGNHVAWCESRYRTYRASDNTYVASAGVRRACVSPR
jgi:hypothetical protein